MIVITMLTFSYVSWPLVIQRIGAVARIFGILFALIWFINWPRNGMAIQETITSRMTVVWLILSTLSEFASPAGFEDPNRPDCAEAMVLEYRP